MLRLTGINQNISEFTIQGLQETPFLFNGQKTPYQIPKLEQILNTFPKLTFYLDVKNN